MVEQGLWWLNMGTRKRNVINAKPFGFQSGGWCWCRYSKKTYNSVNMHGPGSPVELVVLFFRFSRQKRNEAVPIPWPGYHLEAATHHCWVNEWLCTGIIVDHTHIDCSMLFGKMNPLMHYRTINSYSNLRHNIVCVHVVTHQWFVFSTVLHACTSMICVLNNWQTICPKGSN